MKIISRQIHLEGHIFNVEKLLVQLPDGRERFYDLVDHGDAVTILPLDGEGRIGFVSQYRVGAEKELLELPAGMLDGEEPAEAGARRELREETGMDARDLSALGGFWIAAGYSNEYIHAFLARGLYASPLEQDDDEFLSLSWLPIKEAYQTAFSGKIQDSKTLAAMLLALPIIQSGFSDLLINHEVG
ncbi:MAG: NUDIX hydrolase [Anaerolineaceae bacterium]|jgi:ADP-ribose pyrophosphatase